jgi:hypothetical protein
MIKNSEEQVFISAHHLRLAKAGAQDYWIGLSNIQNPSKVG